MIGQIEGTGNDPAISGHHQPGGGASAAAHTRGRPATGGGLSYHIGATAGFDAHHARGNAVHSLENGRLPERGGILPEG